MYGPYSDSFSLHNLGLNSIWIPWNLVQIIEIFAILNILITGDDGH